MTTLIKEKVNIKGMILQHPHRILNAVAEEIDDLTEVLDILEASVDFISNIENHAAGIALPQLGISKRAFVARVAMKIKGKKESVTEVFINPKYKVMNKKSSFMPEGCLSIEGVLAEVKRPKSIFVSYTSLDGKRKNAFLEDFSARVFLHELDHLNGVVITDIGEIIE